MEVQIKPLLKLSSIDAPPKFLQSLQDAGKFVKKLRESDPDIANSAANRSGTEEEHRALQAGLLYLALTEPDRRRSYCTDIVLTSRDNLTYALSEMTRLVAETWPKMPQSVRTNLLSLLGELIVARASVEVLILHICRRMSSGDLSSGNLWLIETMVDLLEKNKDWLTSPERQAFLLPLIVFTFLRLIPDHHTSSAVMSSSQVAASTAQQPGSLATLRQRELNLTEELIRKHFDRCAQLGRDFIRLLHGVARLDPMRRLWDDILQNMPLLSSHFSSVADVLEITTPQCFTQTLIPHEMEQWARWMMKNVHCVPRVPVNRYQEFFQRKFFATPESQSLRVCLLRYIVTFFYPDNEMLASTLIPRWNVISWILSQSTCAVVTANAKLALFYDWLFFKPNGCIMNLEPALLAMMNHLTPRTQPIALSLVDFLVKIVGTYHPPMTDRIVAGVRSGLEEMIRLGVVKNINPLFEMLHRTSPDLLRALRSLLGCEPIIGAPSPGLADVSGRLTNSDKPEVPIDGFAPHSPGIPTAQSSVLRRPSTPPLAGVKPKQATSESGALSDPRLTRGQAAILAGALPTPTVSPIMDGSAKSIEPLVPVTPTSLSSVAHQPTIPIVIPTMPLADESKPKPVPKRHILHLPVGQNLANQTAQPEPILSELDLDKLDIDRITEEDARFTRASWSPPPLPPSQAIVHGDKTDQLPETPESIELTIDNLRRRFQDYQLRYRYCVEPVDVSALIDLLEGPIRSALEAFRDLAIRFGLVRTMSGGMVCADRGGDEPDLDLLNGEVDKRTSSVRLRSASVLVDLCVAMENLVQAVLAEDCFDDLDIAGRTAGVVCELLFPLFAERLMPAGTEWSEEQLEDCLQFPIFVPFRHLWEMNPGDPKRELLLLLLTEMQTKQPRLGYHLLFFLKVSNVNDETMTIYRNFCASQENPNLRDSLFKDMQLLADDNRRLFAYLLPDVYTVFASELMNDAGFMHLVVSTLDPSMCNTLICEIVRGHMNMFQSDDLSPLLKASLQWNSIEQFFFWQLINAHEIPTRSFLPLVKCVEPAKHPEATANLILLFKLEKPSFELVRALLSRSGPNDALSVTALHFWSCPDNQHASRFASILKSMIMTPLSQRAEGSLGGVGSSTSARDARDKRRNGGSKHVSPENCVDLPLILTHLDAMRKNCRNISRVHQPIKGKRYGVLQDEDVQLALQSVANSRKVPLSVKDHFSDLLALAEDQPSAPTGSSKGSEDSLSPDALHRLSGTSLGSDTGKRLSFSGRTVQMGSKGGHSLRNLDSRRAAEAERRQLPVVGSATKRSSRTSANQNNNGAGADSDNEDNEAMSSTGSSSDSSDEEDEKPSVASGNRKKRNSRNSSPSGSSRQSDQSSSKSSSGKRVVTSEGSKDRRPSNKRALNRFESTLNKSDEDDDEDDDDKGLEVVVLEEDSGDEKNNDDSDKVRPPKRRKTSNRRFVLDD
ncbi:hypothetical protein CRM22_008120 [Opisthorchis felineus]|uniref:SOSS complex subunit A homolog n=1 Tax=Opisthorchis felineus TaxID=147828 RepID=A0A4S2LCM9_OPIFE|nr:hypothetical protein CRM22_008120 [Opisthorchis felineus]